MTRRPLAALAVALLLVTAGCQTTTQDTTRTTHSTEPTAMVTDTLTPPTTTNTTTHATTTAPAFEVNASYANCTTLHVNASTALNWVGVLTTEGVREYNPSGSTAMVAAEGVIEYALVQDESGDQVKVVNPGYEACVAARETTEKPTTTVATVETTTPRTTEKVTTTVPTTTTTITTQEPRTTQATTTAREPLRDYKITTHVKNESLADGYTEVRVKNWHEASVRLDYDVVWYSDRDIMMNVDRHSLVLESGESVVLESWYGGNGSAYSVEYVVNNLEYTNQ